MFKASMPVLGVAGVAGVNHGYGKTEEAARADVLQFTTFRKETPVGKAVTEWEVPK